MSSVLQQSIVILSNPHHLARSPSLAKPSSPPPVGLSGATSSNLMGMLSVRIRVRTYVRMSLSESMRESDVSAESTLASIPLLDDSQLLFVGRLIQRYVNAHFRPS